MNPAVARALAAALDAPANGWTRLGGGFTENWRCRTPACFIKLSGDAERLAAEADGLAALAATGAFRVPRVLARGEAAGMAFLALEWLDLEPLRDGAAIGRALAAQHAVLGPQHGWRRDNFLGATPQENRPDDDWAHFFTGRRLRPQIERALAAGVREIEAPLHEVLVALPDLLGDHRPPPALLHGDLWSGNAGMAGGRPAVFDPAVHFGDAECDLAMATLFGGFPADFETDYAALRPPAAGWRARRRLYQLYHLLNHLNLFGRGYLPQVLAVAASLGRGAR